MLRILIEKNIFCQKLKNKRWISRAGEVIKKKVENIWKIQGRVMVKSGQFERNWYPQLRRYKTRIFETMIPKTHLELLWLCVRNKDNLDSLPNLPLSPLNDIMRVIVVLYSILLIWKGNSQWYYKGICSVLFVVCTVTYLPTLTLYV